MLRHLQQEFLRRTLLCSNAGRHTVRRDLIEWKFHHFETSMIKVGLTTRMSCVRVTAAGWLRLREQSPQRGYSCRILLEMLS